MKLYVCMFSDPIHHWLAIVTLTAHKQKAKDLDLTPWAKALPERFVAILLDKDGEKSAS